MHRDLRPENLMLSYSPTAEFALPIKIGDFGLCRTIHSENTKTSTLTFNVGHGYHRAPETEGNEHRKQADLFSLGLIIWEVAQLIKPKMFYKLVHESKTHLVKIQPSLMREFVISLTKRRIQDRAKFIPHHLIMSNSKDLIVVHNELELINALDICNHVDTIQLENFASQTYSEEFQLNTSNVTICAKERTGNAIVGRLTITGNCCAIKFLELKQLKVTGHRNIITDSTSGQLEVSGNINILEHCFAYCQSYSVHIKGSDNSFLWTNFINAGFLGVIISGSRNTIQNFEVTCRVNAGLNMKEKQTNFELKLKLY